MSKHVGTSSVLTSIQVVRIRIDALLQFQRLFGKVFRGCVGVVQRQFRQQLPKFGIQIASLRSIGEFDGEEESQIDARMLAQSDDGFRVQRLSHAPEIVVAPIVMRLRDEKEEEVEEEEGEEEEEGRKQRKKRKQRKGRKKRKKRKGRKNRKKRRKRKGRKKWKGEEEKEEEGRKKRKRRKKWKGRKKRKGR